MPVPWTVWVILGQHFRSIFFCKAQGDAVAEKLREVQCKDAVTTPLKINGWNPNMEVWFRSFSFLNG